MNKLLSWCISLPFINKLKLDVAQIRFNIQFLGMCILAGVGSALFSLATDKAVILSSYLFHRLHYWIIAYTAAMFVAIVILLKRYFPYAGGSGLPQGYALDVFDKHVLGATYSIKTMIGKILLTIMSIVSGASLGREGPTIQICASIFASFKHISLKRKRFLIRIGSGVGVATAFNAPLGGIIFALEEYIKHSDSKANVFLLLGIGVAGYFTVLLSGDYSYMGSINVMELYYSWQIILISLISGIICGLLGALYTYLMVIVSVGINSKFCIWRKRNYIFSALLFGIVVGVLAILTHGYSFSNGATTTANFLQNNQAAPWYYWLSKSLGSIFSVAAGVPGGYFSTALSIGAGIMSDVHHLLPLAPLKQYYLLGMVGFLSSITLAPITAIAMIMSIVSDTQHFALPLILTAIVANYVASLFGDSVYHQQVLLYIDKNKYKHTK